MKKDNMKKVLTVVIPTYNMEKYLAHCLESFIFDEAEKGLEILIVNDGSKDNSINIAKSYENKYPNIFKVIDKENGGHGSTINEALKVATGKYFKVVDADDWVDTKEFEKLFKELKILEVDCVVCNYNLFFEHSNKVKKVDMCANKPLDIVKIESLSDFAFAMHSLTFKTEKIKNVRLQEHCFYVDIEYNLYGFANCDTIKYIPFLVYQYRLGRMGQSVSPQGLFKHRLDIIKVCNNIITFLNLLNKKENKYKLISSDVVNVLIYTYKDYITIYNFDKKVKYELKEVDAWLKQYEDLYNETHKNKVIKALRASNFEKIKYFNRIFLFKQFIKKILGRA